jgi:hypothetical protein
MPRNTLRLWWEVPKFDRKVNVPKVDLHVLSVTPEITNLTCHLSSGAHGKHALAHGGDKLTRAAQIMLHGLSFGAP